MAMSTNFGLHQDDSTRRRFGRVMCRDIRCSLGEVLDLSAKGMRVRTTSAPPAVGADIMLAIETLKGRMAVDVRAAWVHKKGWRTREVGFSFGDLDTGVRQALADLARAAAHNECLKQR